MRFSQRSQTSSKLCLKLHLQLHLATFERLAEPFLLFTPHLRGLVVHFPAETQGVQWSVPRETMEVHFAEKSYSCYRCSLITLSALI